jgi:hypothetical protein
VSAPTHIGRFGGDRTAAAEGAQSPGLDRRPRPARRRPDPQLTRRPSPGRRQCLGDAVAYGRRWVRRAGGGRG